MLTGLILSQAAGQHSPHVRGWMTPDNPNLAVLEERIISFPKAHIICTKDKLASCKWLWAPSPKPHIQEKFPEDGDCPGKTRTMAVESAEGGRLDSGSVTIICPEQTQKLVF